MPAPITITFKGIVTEVLTFPIHGYKGGISTLYVYAETHPSRFSPDLGCPRIYPSWLPSPILDF